MDMFCGLYALGPVRAMGHLFLTKLVRSVVLSFIRRRRIIKGSKPAKCPTTKTTKRFIDLGVKFYYIKQNQSDD